MFEQTFKNIDDVLWKDAGCGSELDYVEQTSSARAGLSRSDSFGVTGVQFGKIETSFL